MTKTRAIRFSEQDEKKIEEFLSKNTFLDFSSLARLAIINFIQQPKIDIKPISIDRKKSESRRPHGTH
jgi:hypothetical protein